MAHFDIEGKSVHIGGPTWFKPNQPIIDWSVRYVRRAFADAAGFEKKDMAAAFVAACSPSSPEATVEKVLPFVGQIIKEFGKLGFIRFENKKWIPADAIKHMQHAPITDAQRAMLHARASDIAATARCRGLDFDSWSLRSETEAARRNFELGCWLYFYKSAGSLPLDDRVDCVWRLMAEGVGNPGYDFYTVFEFGEREFDSIFEMNDSEDVIFGLKERLEQDFSLTTRRLLSEVFGDAFSDVNRPRPAN